MAPPAVQQEYVAPAASSGGIQNWRYSEFITAVEKDKVEKVRNLKHFVHCSMSSEGRARR